jgi:hypothetical protein
MHSPAPWRKGNNGSVVAERTTRDSDSNRAYYGGDLVCESCRDEDAALIAAAPDLLRLLKERIDGAPENAGGWVLEARRLIHSIEYEAYGRPKSKRSA